MRTRCNKIKKIDRERTGGQGAGPQNKTKQSGRVWRTTTQLLQLRLGPVRMLVWLHRTHFEWFVRQVRATRANEQRLRLPSQRHDP